MSKRRTSYAEDRATEDALEAGYGPEGYIREVYQGAQAHNVDNLFCGKSWEAERFWRYLYCFCENSGEKPPGGIPEFVRERENYPIV